MQFLLTMSSSFSLQREIQRETHQTACPLDEQTMRYGNHLCSYDCPFGMNNIFHVCCICCVLSVALIQRGGSINGMKMTCAIKKGREEKKVTVHNFTVAAFSVSYFLPVRTLILFVLRVFCARFCTFWGREKKKIDICRKRKCFYPSYIFPSQKILCVLNF